jgi:hypothetical protein
MERQLALGTSQSFAKAREIYEKGAHSKSIATVTLTQDPVGPINEGTEVSGTTQSGAQVTGKVYAGVSSGQRSVQIQYDTISIQNEYVGCRVGANPEPMTTGCFGPSGSIIIGGNSYTYNYDALTATSNGRTLQGFSTDAEEKMYRCTHCPYNTYEKFYEYYGEFDYADKWVQAAFDGKATTFSNGNANFQLYDFEGRTEAIKKGTAYMNVWMYVIRELEDAIDDCVEECDPLEVSILLLSSERLESRHQGTYFSL